MSRPCECPHHGACRCDHHDHGRRDHHDHGRRDHGDHGGHRCRCDRDHRCDHACACSCACDPGDPGGAGDPGGGTGGTTVGWNNPNRPGHTCGTDTGQIPGGTLEPGNFDPGNPWPGPRDEMYLPFLFMRANPGDLGARPVVGPFWESPDILLLAGVDPALAPARPPELGQTALAGRSNTLYAHVWNFGIAQAPNVIVEFYWCDPSLGIGASSANLIGQTMISLGARGSGRAHAVAKCPIGWVPTFVNGGHECLVVRAWEETSDGLGTPPWDAALNRHVAQRNIHVLAAPEQAHALVGGAGAAAAGLLTAPLTLKVGPLYGEPAQIAVERVAPNAMPWLQQRTGVRGRFPAQAVPTGPLLLGAPRPVGGGVGFGGDQADRREVTADDQQVTFAAGDTAPAPGQAHVYRVTATQLGQVFGGYTVVLLG